jgi:hypothetical protein
MKRGRLFISFIALSIVAVLIISGLYYLDLSNRDAEKGGRKVAWTFGARDSGGNQAYFALDSIRPDGMIYGTAQTDSETINKGNYLYMRYFIALNPDGTLNWTSGTNAGAVPTMGPDGNFYYVDWPFKPWNSSSDYQGGWYNLTSIDHTGHFRWDYLMNGTMDFWGVFPDGLVVVHHYGYQYDYNLNRSVALVDEVVGIANGSLVWRLDRPLPEFSYTDPEVNSNGTFTIKLSNGTTTYAFTINEIGSQTSLEKIQYYYGYRYPKSSTHGTIQYEVRKEVVDNDTMVTSVYAINLTNGDQVWRTILDYSGNPQHQPYFGWEGGLALVDANGTIYCNNLEGNYSYALDLNGNILWKKPYLGILTALDPVGGVLVVDSSSIRRIDRDGSTAWRYESESVSPNVLVSQNDTIYFISDSGVNSLIFSTDHSGYQFSVLVLGMVDAAVIIVLLLILWSYRHKKGHDRGDQRS